MTDTPCFFSDFTAESINLQIWSYIFINYSKHTYCVSAVIWQLLSHAHTHTKSKSSIREPNATSPVEPKYRPAHPSSTHARYSIHTHTHAHIFSLNLDDWVFSYLIGSAVSATLPLSFRSKERITHAAPFPSLSRYISSALSLSVFPMNFPPLTDFFFPLFLLDFSLAKKSKRVLFKMSCCLFNTGAGSLWRDCHLKEFVSLM